ncbi:Pseudouridine synthase TruD [Penicillium cf. griseofulvum]|uniref:Pseudouridine synthase TruD n=1 Tax=Penicillium cf. griseofulvum TaxID=2972120 RepID=A0A9W9J0D7_9EURO|nr:Pseudouridine synthase TruD [Penicillium cf. griseofulvum]KAJ5422994.1 Pseudouridine synthase TruD [Penicillium cf. griseofulvum]KAJ5433789.1 Pseudouridine synthase TruD [Penicillium cf. griseofulvum]
MEKPDIVESPRKRQKTEDAGSTEVAVVVNDAIETASTAVSDAQALKEVEVGITEFVSNDTEGFTGILKKRYTDFMVNEITTTGEVVHLRSIDTPSKPASTTTEPTTSAPKASEVETKATEKTEATPAKKVETPAEFKVSEEDRTLLEEYFGPQNASEIIALHKVAMAKPKGRPSEFGKVTVAVSDRDLRTKMHQAIRRIFNSQLESSTDAEGNMTITAANNRFKRGATGERANGRTQGHRTNWEELGGPYLHFTIYKENKDTMEVIGFISRSLKMNPKSLQFAGTKDRRGVTAQRACAVRVQVDRLARVNSELRNAFIGDFEYRKQGLELGDLQGNEFIVTLRDVEIPGVSLSDPQAAIAKASEIVGTSLKNLYQRGYFNYYGLQRFGTFATRTDTIGVKMLQGDFKGACDAILQYAPESLQAAMEGKMSTANIGTDDKDRAMAINMYQTGGSVTDALQKMPRKFSAESNLLRHLGRNKKDYLGALQCIPRNLRLMYVHAYQSLVWNFAASERWRLYGDRVVEGDLVIIQEHREKESDSAVEAAETVDADGEIIVVPQGEDSAVAAEDMFMRARPLTAEEAASGKYTIFDLVLPQPGYDIIYPENEMKEFYRRFMQSEQGGGLDPTNMRRKWKDISLSGGYRKVFSRMVGDNYSFDVKLYSKDDEQFVKTDMQKLKPKDENADTTMADETTADKMAVVLKFQLGSSQYATMALRELTHGKATAHKPDFGGGR